MSEDSNRRPAWRWLLPAALPCIAIFFWPSFDSPFIGAKITLLLIVGEVAAFALFGKNAGKIFPDKFFQWSALLWILVFALSTLFAHNWAESWHVIAIFAAATIFFAALIRQKISVDSLLWAIAISAIAVSMVAISGHFGYDLPRLFMSTAAPGRMRTASTLGNPLFVSSFLACGLWAIFLLPVHFAARVSAGLLTVAGMLLTTERTGIFALMLGLIVFASIRATRLRFPLLAIALILTAAPFIHGNPRSLKTTTQGRIFLWKTALHHVTLLGQGPGSFYRVYNQSLRETAPAIPPSEFHFINYETDSYSIYVQAIVETGVLGLLAMLIFFAAWFRMAWRLRGSPVVACALAGVAAFLAAGISDDPLSRPEGMVLLAAWLAVPVLVLSRDNPAIFKIESSRLGLRLFSSVMMVFVSLLLLAAAAGIAFSNYAVHAGENAEDRNDWTQAERWDRAVLKYDPANRDAHYNLVRVLAQEGNYQASLTESEDALHWVDEAELHLIRIRILPMVGKTQQAEQELLRARKEFPWSEELQQEKVSASN